MKDKEKRNKKGNETTIGKIIYGFLLFMPLLAIGATCLISTFNMSAKEETEITYKYETNEVNSNQDIVNGNIYLVNLEDYHRLYGVDTLVNLSGELNLTWVYTTNEYELYIPNAINVSLEDSATPLYTTKILFNSEINDNIFYYGWFDNIISINFNQFQFFYIKDKEISNEVPLVIDIYEIENINPNFYSYIKPVTDYSMIPIESVETHNLDTQEVFYNAVDKVTESPLFNWAQNSIIYTTTSSTCTALSITTPFIPLLLSYWLIISVIYFLYDIVLMLIWVLHDRIHALKDSIT